MLKNRAHQKTYWIPAQGFLYGNVYCEAAVFKAPVKKQDVVCRTRQREKRNPQRFLLFGPLKESKSSQNENFAAVGRMGLVFKKTFSLSSPLYYRQLLVSLYPQ
jgi:hypothetical protein